MNFVFFVSLPSIQVDFGILFDVDGVLARGSTPLDPAKKAVEKLKDSEGNLTVPVAFVTNACNRSADKAKQISNWFDINVSTCFFFPFFSFNLKKITCIIFMTFFFFFYNFYHKFFFIYTF